MLATPFPLVRTYHPAVVENGDWIELDVANRRLHLDIEPGEPDTRLRNWQPPELKHLCGYLRLYIDHVLQADEGCDFNFLRPESNAALDFVPPVVGGREP